MDSIKLECFLAVAEMQSFSKASDKLYKNQSVISRQVAALEKELNVTLFVRRGRTVTLTPAGKVFESGIRKITNTFNSLLDSTVAVQNGYGGEISIGLHQGNLSLGNVIPIVRSFEKEFPEICVSLHPAYSGEMQNRLNNNTIDTVFWRWEEYSASEREFIFVCKCENGLLFSKDYPLFFHGKDQFELSDFKDETFLVLPERVAPGLGRRLYKICTSNGFESRMAEIPDLETGIIMVSMQRGTICMNDGGFFARNNDFRFVRIPQLGTTDMSFIWDKRNPNPCLKVFLDFVARYNKFYPGVKQL